jgi:hypothetical protein
MQQGTTFSVPPAEAMAGDMYGYAHFGPEAGNVGTDILDDMGEAPGAIGFTPPLPAGSYTIWLQQGTPPITAYQLSFNVLRPGDYNGDGLVGAADYTVWRNTAGSTTDFRADNTGPIGVPDGVVDRLDFDYWKQHYGEGEGAAADQPAAVPESTTLVLTWLAMLGICRRRERETAKMAGSQYRIISRGLP